MIYKILSLFLTLLLFNHVSSQQLIAFSTFEGPTARIGWSSTALLSSGNMVVVGTTRDELHHVYNGVSTQYHFNATYYTQNGFFGVLNPDKELLSFRKWYPHNHLTGFLQFDLAEVDQDDNVYLTGYTQGKADVDPPPIGNGGPFIGTDSNSRAQSFILKLDSSGNYLWSKELELASPDPAYNSIFDICSASNGDLIVVGGFFKSTDFDPGPGTQIRTSDDFGRGFVLRLDASGNYISVKVYDDYPYDNGLWQIEPTSSGGYYLRGLFRDSIDLDLNGNNPTVLAAHGEPVLYSDGFIARYDSNDDLLWGYQLPPKISCRTIQPDAEDNIYFTGQVYPGAVLDNGDSASIPFSIPEMLLEKLDGNGNYQWHAMITGNGFETSNNIAVEEDSVYVLYGFHEQINTQSLANDTTITNIYAQDAVALSVFDYQGQHLQTMTIQSPSYVERAWNMMVTGTRVDLNFDIHGPTDLDPGPAVATYSPISHSEGVAMLAWDLDLPFVPNSLSPGEAINWQIFPNPSSGVYEVRVATPGAARQVQVFDLTGRELQEHTFRGLGTQLDLTNMPAGMYLVQLTVGERSVMRRVVKD